MSRQEAVTFSEFYLFEESDHGAFTFPANDPLPLYGMPWMQNTADDAALADPAASANSGTMHLYSAPGAGAYGGPGGPCFAGWGRWEIQQVMVTNANPYAVFWCLFKFPPSTYKDITAPATHTFRRYTGVAPAPADVVDIRLHALFYAEPIAPFQTFTTEKGYRAIVQAGESLWGTVYPGWQWGSPDPRQPSLPASPTKATTLRVTGDIVE